MLEMTGEGLERGGDFFFGRMRSWEEEVYWSVANYINRGRVSELDLGLFLLREEGIGGDKGSRLVDRWISRGYLERV